MPYLVVKRHPGKGKCLTIGGPFRATVTTSKTFSVDPDPGTEESPVPPASRRIRLSGHVQGVGFRPFVFRLAGEFDLAGWVQNQLGEVEILVQGPIASLDRFQDALLRRAPPLSRPVLDSVVTSDDETQDGFRIVGSASDTEARIHVPPDYFTCDDCVRELADPGDRRYRYPFINCTQCGPRYTLIRAMPYDRPNTSMADFPLCGPCRQEYEDPGDRRFHAEPVACPACGPSLEWRESHLRVEGNDAALEACLQALRRGRVVAVKGVGGYHLMCDARADGPISRLRTAKPRPHKPLAVMFPVTGADGLAAIREEVEADTAEIELLLSPARPIVLLPRRPKGKLSGLVAPGLGEIGVMLPYSPLHHLLTAAFGAPLVATSGNVSGEPVLTDATEVEQRIARVAEAFLHHDRPIVRPADDSVYRSIAGKPRPLRLGRGMAPREMILARPLPAPVLAVGGHMKNTVALAWDERMVVSPHIGDMGTARSLAVFEQVVEDLQALYRVRVSTVIADAHPDYATTRWARKSGLPTILVHHHFAHASGAARDWPDGETGVVFAWDGVGLGPDGTLWGGETLVGRPGRWKRVGHIRPFRLPGGDMAGREPWRSAAAVCWETGRAWAGPRGTDWQLAQEAWRRRMNAPQTTAVGRLFDAASSLVGLLDVASFEGQGPMQLEAAADPACQATLALPMIREREALVTDWEPLIDLLRDSATPVGQRAAVFHNSLAGALAQQALAVRGETGARRVALTGGVFQNRLLVDRVRSHLGSHGIEAEVDESLPVNDGGLCAGQVVEYAAGIPV